MNTCVIKCHNGFLSTIHRGTTKEELRDIHENNGLQNPVFVDGNARLFENICMILVNLGICG